MGEDKKCFLQGGALGDPVLAQIHPYSQKIISLLLFTPCHPFLRFKSKHIIFCFIFNINPSDSCPVTYCLTFPLIWSLSGKSEWHLPFCLLGKSEWHLPFCLLGKSEWHLFFCLSGKSEWCPRDVGVQDGTECNNKKAFCYDGRCRSHTSQVRRGAWQVQFSYFSGIRRGARQVEAVWLSYC